MVQLYFTSQMTFHPKKQKSTRTSSFPHAATEKLKYFNFSVASKSSARKIFSRAFLEPFSRASLELFSRAFPLFSATFPLERENLPHGRHFFTFRSLVRTNGNAIYGKTFFRISLTARCEPRLRVRKSQ